MAPQGPQMGVTGPLPYALPPVLSLDSSVPAEGIYLRQVTRGNIVFGGGLRGAASIQTRRATADPMRTARQLPRLRRLIPGLANVRVIRSWSGVEGYLPDMIPVIGPSAKMPGLFYAFGFCGHGFQLGPGVGETMAELIATGSPGVPLDPFSVARFTA